MRIAITTLGCKVNQYDSAVIRGRLEAESHSFVPFEAEADVYIINACTVTDRADWEARQLVRRAKRLSPRARVLVTGCYAQVSPQEVAGVPGVDYVVGLNRLEDLVRYAGQQAPPSASEIAVGDVKRERRVALFGANGIPDRTRAFLKIQEGCNYSCTYCIIPAARGRSRSVPPDQVLSQLGALAGQGYKEVVLTGIHLGGYGHDLSPKWDLTSLAERVVAGNLIPRLRLSSLDPREVSDRLLELMQRSELLCPHLHLCLQAGEDRLLKRMRRNYDTAYYRDLIWRARERVPDAALGTDIIVGFPGESEEDFARSLEFVDSLPLTYFHVFPYSVRRGTVAASLSGQVPAREKRLRAKRMRELGAKKKEEFHRRFVGRRLSVLVESEAGPGCFQGHSRNYLPVFVREAALRPNDEVNVQVDGCGGRGLSGVVCRGNLP